MMECLHCGRAFPEVVGAPTQVCPHCGHEMEEPKPAGAIRVASPVDPVGAITLAARVASREYPRLLALFLPAFAIEVAAWLAIMAYGRAAGLPEDVAAMNDGQSMQLLGVALPLLLVMMSVRYASWSFVAARTLDVVIGGSRLARWRMLVAPALLVGFVLILALSAGAVLLIVGLFVVLHWFVYAPAFLAAGAPTVGSAFERSRRFARDHRTYGFTALIALIGGALFSFYFVLGALPAPWGSLVPAFLAWIAGPIVPLLAASFVALSMQAPRSISGSASAPATARTTTTCPKCVTLISYTPGPGPVAVTCPACGHAGNVL